MRQTQQHFKIFVPFSPFLDTAVLSIVCVRFLTVSSSEFCYHQFFTMHTGDASQTCRYSLQLRAYGVNLLVCVYSCFKSSQTDKKFLVAELYRKPENMCTPYGHILWLEHSTC